MFLRRLALIALLIPSIGALWAADTGTQTIRYSVISNSRTAGIEVDTYGPGAQVESTFEYNDRGRGPKIAAHYKLSENSLPLETTVTGNDYLKAPVDEHFRLENGVGTWKSTSENGQAQGNGFYISNNGPAAENAFLVSALLKANGAPVKLFPAGEARLEEMGDATLDNKGQKLHVTEYAITGCHLSRRRSGLTMICTSSPFPESG